MTEKVKIEKIENLEKNNRIDKNAISDFIEDIISDDSFISLDDF